VVGAEERVARRWKRCPDGRQAAINVCRNGIMAREMGTDDGEQRQCDDEQRTDEQLRPTHAAIISCQRFSEASRGRTHTHERAVKTT
jgi:hypothetical protein